MITRLIGDIHGDIRGYKEIIKDAKSSIQVGDFGIGFGSDLWHDNINRAHATGNHRFIRGNHDNPGKCKSMTGYIKDGTLENDVMFIGGAWSIDRGYRTENVDWWADEELSISELNTLVDVYCTMKPRIMITHDCPEEVSKTMFVNAGLAMHKPAVRTRTGQAFQAMIENHKPDAWYFGHWHHTLSTYYGRTQFCCLGINDYVDVDLGAD